MLSKKLAYLSAVATAVIAAALLLGSADEQASAQSGVIPTASAATLEIQLALTVSEESVPVRAPVMLRGTVTKGPGGDPIAGAIVSFQITRPGGTTTITLTADKEGVAEWKYKAQHEGVYSIVATASSGDRTTTSAPATFSATKAQNPAKHSQPRSFNDAIARLF